MMHRLSILVLTLMFWAFSAQLSNAQQATTTQEKLPVAIHYTGGEQALYAELQKNMVYPPTAKRNRIQGTCIVHFALEADGTISKPSVVKNIGGGCGDEALRLVKLLKFNAPGYRAEYQIPVNFKL